MKRVIRSNENPRIKILSRKGNSHIGMYADTTNTLKTSPVIQELHDFVDVNEKKGCEIEALKKHRM